MGVFAEYEAAKGGSILQTCSGVEHVGSRDPKRPFFSRLGKSCSNDNYRANQPST